MRIFREKTSITIFVGPWAVRFSWSRTGHFGNGSRWCSGVHRWRDEL